MKGLPWTEAELALLRGMWADGADNESLCAAFPRHPLTGICGMASGMGLGARPGTRPGPRGARSIVALSSQADPDMFSGMIPVRVPPNDPLLAQLRRFHPDRAC